MKPLPQRGLVEFERKVERAWSQSGRLSLKRDGLIVGLGLLGLRWVEVSVAIVKDLAAADGNLCVRSAKGGNRRVVPVGRSWMQGCRELLAVTRPAVRGSERLFITAKGRALSYTHIRRTIKRWTRMHFGQAFTFHCLRHTAAWRVYLATRDVLEVQRLLGHASLRHTQEYLQELTPVGVDGLASFVEGDRPAVRLFDPDSDSADAEQRGGLSTERKEGRSSEASRWKTLAGGAEKEKDASSGSTTSAVAWKRKRRCECYRVVQPVDADGLLVAPFVYARRPLGGRRGVRLAIGCSICKRLFGFVSDREMDEHRVRQERMRVGQQALQFGKE